MRNDGQQLSGEGQASSMAGAPDAVTRKGKFSMFGRWLAVVAALGSGVGCSDLDPATETYATHYNLLPSNWRCLDPIGAAPPQQPATPLTAPPTFTAYVPDYSRPQQIVTGLTAIACLITDPICANPVGEGMANPRDAMTAGVKIPLFPAFEGFIRLQAEGYITQDYYINGPINGNIQLTQALSMVSLPSAAAFITRIGGDPAFAIQQGILAAQVFDCDNDEAANVTLVLSDPQQQQVARPFAQQDRLPIANRPTDDEGIAGFINLPPVAISVEAEVNGRRFGSRGFDIKPGVLTSGTIRPSYEESGY
jgi:hypothetical protein